MKWQPFQVEFEHKCPLTGKTKFEAKWSCNLSKNKDGFCQNSTGVRQYLHEAHTLEIVGLKGGFHYDVWVEATVNGCHDEDSCASSSPKRDVYVGCKFRCNDGTCLNQRRDVR